MIGFGSNATMASDASCPGQRVRGGAWTRIRDLVGYMVAGDVRLSSGLIVLGRDLADDLALSISQTLRLESSNGVTMALTLSGIFKTGNGGMDGTCALTGLDAVTWTDGAEQLMEALNAQAQTGCFLKTFALITIVIGVASALLLSTYRPRPEIGIIRAMGAGRVFVIFVFVAQAAQIGLMGGIMGAALGYDPLLPFPSRDAFQSGTLPMDITQGSYGLAISRMVIGAILVSILPTRSAARVDPVTAIGQ